MILGILLISILLAYYMYFRQMRRKLYKLSDSLPDIGSLPLIGHTHWFLGGPEKILGNIEKLSDLVLERTDTTKIWVGPTFYFVTVNPEDVAKILENCLQKDVSYRFLRDWLGNGLFVSQVDQWRIHRRALMPIFQNRNVEEYIDIFAEQSLVLVERLRERSGQPPFDVYPLITSCTLDIVFETAIGEKMDVQRNPDTPYLRARRYILQVINMRIFKAWLRPEALFRLTPHFKSQKDSIDLTHKFTDEVVQRKRDIYDKQGFPNEGRKDFLEHILSKNSNYTNEQLREHIDSITIAGNDTTALVIAYTLLAMGIHQDIQEKVYQEQKAIFGDSMRPATKEDMSKMEYLERVMKETMRFYTVVPIIGRETEKEIKLSTCTLPPGVSCAVLPFMMHRSKALWGPDVKEFDPDRFLPERSVGRHPCAFLAFSHGTRNCIGRHYGMLLMKTIVSNIVRNFRIFSKAPTRFKIEIIMFPVDGHLITVEPRL